MKQCTKCKVLKPAKEFDKDKQKKSGRRPDCKKCSAERAAVYRAKHPEKVAKQRKKYAALNREKLNAYQKNYNKQNPLAVKNRQLKHYYGISVFDFLFLQEMQDHKCAICFNSGPLVVDHNHTTKAVRGLLCHSCNLSLGRLDENADTCISMAKYIKEHNGVKNV